jgi:hypothetical protein
MGTTIPVEITVYADRSFTFITKTPPAAVLLRQAAGIPKGSGVPNKDKVATITGAQIRQIAADQAAGFERRGSRFGHAHDCGHRPLHGDPGRGLSLPAWEVSRAETFDLHLPPVGEPSEAWPISRLIGIR